MQKENGKFLGEFPYYRGKFPYLNKKIHHFLPIYNYFCYLCVELINKNTCQQDS